ncbi:MAG: 50S ribosomal protein L30 [Calditrichaeota bacterium]|nr:50S ribosomal protein L30 [Calditrichota bacterium]
MPEMVRITYTRSSIGCPMRQKRTIRALGFRRLHQSKILKDSKSLRGMLLQVAHLVKVTPAPISEPAAVVVEPAPILTDEKVDDE